MLPKLSMVHGQCLSAAMMHSLLAETQQLFSINSKANEWIPSTREGRQPETPVPGWPS